MATRSGKGSPYRKHEPHTHLLDEVLPLINISLIGLGI